MKNWFEVDKKGLAKLLERRGKEFAVFELIANAWDEPGVTDVKASLVYEVGGHSRLVVEDNSTDGFKDLSHAFTLFAESKKKTDAEKRGRFNLGEKLVLALSKHALIKTKNGGVMFGDAGRRNVRSAMTSGSRIECLIKISERECEAVNSEINKLIPPAGIKTTWNGRELNRPSPVKTVRAELMTEVAALGGEGILGRTRRFSQVEIYRADAGMLYEMGIPVVETGDSFSVNVMQKIPLTLDRENVLPSYLRDIRVLVLNHTAHLLNADEANKPWVTQAVESPDCNVLATDKVMDLRFGKNRVAYDPSDPEANKIAVSKGFTVVHGGMMSGQTWQNVKAAALIKPAGQVTPSAKVWDGEDNPDALVCKPIPIAEWTPAMREIAEYSRKVSALTIHKDINVKFYCSSHMIAAASYGPGCGLAFNKLRLGNDFFNLAKNRTNIDALLIHEFGHEHSLDHLSKEYYEALCLIASNFVQAARAGKI